MTTQGNFQWELEPDLSFLYLPGDPDEKIPTAGGKVSFHQWCKDEVKRLNSMNPDRHARLDENFGKIGVLARCYSLINYHKK